MESWEPSYIKMCIAKKKGYITSYIPVLYSFLTCSWVKHVAWYIAVFQLYTMLLAFRVLYTGAI